VRAQGSVSSNADAHTNFTLRDMDAGIGEIAQSVRDIKRLWSNVTMPKTNVDDKDEGPLAESKDEEIFTRLEEVSRQPGSTKRK